MLKIAFASDDRLRVNLHFGGADTLVVYDVSPGRADLIGVGRFVKADPTGTRVRAGLADTAQDKLAAKLEFLEGCTAVYATSVGASAIRRLMRAGIQPIIVEDGRDILDLLDEVSSAIRRGGLAWVERAVARAKAATPAPRASDAGQRPLG